MTITALDIQQEGFEHSMRGYDITQVDEFLERVAQEVDAMNAQIAQLQQRLAEAPAAVAEPVVDTAALDAATRRATEAEQRLAAAEARSRQAESKLAQLQEKFAPLQRQLDEKNEMDSAISNAFISAQRSADALKEDARAEGERIYRESEAKAREFIREALSEKQRILNEIDALENSAARFREDYKKLLSRFAGEAENDFANLRPPQIPDNIVNDVLPKYEDLKGEPDASAPVPVPVPAGADAFGYAGAAAGAAAGAHSGGFSANPTAGASFGAPAPGAGQDSDIISTSMSELLDDTALIDEIDE